MKPRRVRNILVFGLWMLLIGPKWSKDACSGAPAQGRQFRPAEFCGMRMGISTIKEAVRKLGNPRTSVKGEDGSLYLSYENVGPIPGKVELLANPRSGVVHTVVQRVTAAKTADVMKLLGGGFVESRWEYATCLDQGGFAPLFRKEDGSVAILENPEKGIVLSFDGGPGFVVEYASKPPGLPRDPCQNAKSLKRGPDK